MLMRLLERIRSEREVGVPRRFSIGTLFVLLTLYAVLFRLLVLLGTNTVWTGIICLFFAIVTTGQIVLLRGVRPRAASVISGALACPAILIALVIDESSAQLTGWTLLADGLSRPAAFASALLLLTSVGLGLGYFVGGVLASVFYVIGKVRPSTGIAGLQTSTERLDRLTGDTRLGACAAAIGRRINPCQPRSPLRGALAAFLIPVVLGLLLYPFLIIRLTFPQVMITAASLGTCFAIWSGNFQLWFFWPFILTIVGIFAATWPAEAMSEIAFLQQDFFNNQQTLLGIMRTFGGVVGITVSAFLGWAQWALYCDRGIDNSQPRRLFGLLLPLVAVSVLIGFGLLISNRLVAFSETPVQQLQKRVLDQGGSINYYSWGQSIVGLALGDNSGDDEILQLRPLLERPRVIGLTGSNFTDASVRALDGMHISLLTLSNTSITDKAFSNVSDFSTVHAHLDHNNVGDDLLKDLLSNLRMQQVLQGLKLDSTKITDGGLSLLKPCVALIDLRLNQCEITDDGLMTLVKSAPSLQYLEVKETMVTPQGIAKLQKAMPRCNVKWDEPEAPAELAERDSTEE